MAYVSYIRHVAYVRPRSLTLGTIEVSKRENGRRLMINGYLLTRRMTSL